MTEIYIKINPGWANSESLTGLLESLKLKGHIEYTLTPSPLVDEIQKAFQNLWDHLLGAGMISKNMKLTYEKKKK